MRTKQRLFGAMHGIATHSLWLCATALAAAMIFSMAALSLTGCDNGPGPGGNRVPAAPRGLTATAVSSSRIDLSWNAVAEAAGYNVYVNTSSGGTYTKVGTVYSNGAYSYDLPANATRYYRVTAYNIYGESGYSNTASATTFSSGSHSHTWGSYQYNSTQHWRECTSCYEESVRANHSGSPCSVCGYSSGSGTLNVPTGVTAVTASSTSIMVSWNSVSGATGYRLYRSTSSDTGYSQVGGNISGLTYTNTGLTANTTYYYKVSAYNSTVESSQSSYVYATTTLGNAPAAPTGVTALATGTSPRSSITVGWNSISNAVNYNLYRSTSADGYYTRVATPSTRSYEDTGLSAGVMYYYKVSATTAAGGEGAQSDYAYASTNADFPPPSAIPMSNGSWSYNTFNGGQSEAWFSFTVTSGTDYWVWCHDRDGGNTFDARISAYYADGQGSTIFNGHDNSWGSGARFTASRNVTVYIRVYPYSYSYLTGNPRTYAITFSTTNTRPN